MNKGGAYVFQMLLSSDVKNITLKRGGKFNRDTTNLLAFAYRRIRMWNHFEK